jgi:hypothetical protein
MDAFATPPTTPFAIKSYPPPLVLAIAFGWCLYILPLLCYVGASFAAPALVVLGSRSRTWQLHSFMYLVVVRCFVSCSSQHHYSFYRFSFTLYRSIGTLVLAPYVARTYDCPLQRTMALYMVVCHI